MGTCPVASPYYYYDYYYYYYYYYYYCCRQSEENHKIILRHSDTPRRPQATAGNPKIILR